MYIEICREKGKYSAARKFEVLRNQIRRWTHHKSEWEAISIEERQSLNFINHKKGIHDALFELLYDYVKECLNENIPVTQKSD